ncbi:MAG: TlpA family protein disulfide reductase [Sphingobacteriales bacterium]|nr:TlpA family protein disulfide reductase [Sphingobacteriales bacterium]
MKFWAGFFTGILVCIILLVGYIVLIIDKFENMRGDDLPELHRADSLHKTDFQLQLHELRTDSILDNAVFRDKVVVLNFWEYWCEPCKAEMPGLERLYNSVKDDSVVFAFITTDQVDSVRRSPVVSRHSLPYFYSNTVLPGHFQGQFVPRTYIMNKRGEILVMEDGSRKWDDPSVLHFLDSLKKL